MTTLPLLMVGGPLPRNSLKLHISTTIHRIQFRKWRQPNLQDAPHGKPHIDDRSVIDDRVPGNPPLVGQVKLSSSPLSF